MIVVGHFLKKFSFVCLIEQGKNMPEHERRELAARVALSFGLQMGE